MSPQVATTCEIVPVLKAHLFGWMSTPVMMIPWRSLRLSLTISWTLLVSQLLLVIHGSHSIFKFLSLKYATANSIKMLSTFGFYDIPVVRGSETPLMKSVPPSTVHGNLGMFGAEHLEEKFSPIIDDSEGIDTIYAKLKEHFETRH
jgi:hypothetical protein